MATTGGLYQRRRTPAATRPRGLTLIVGLREKEIWSRWRFLRNWNVYHKELLMQPDLVKQLQQWSLLATRPSLSCSPKWSTWSAWPSCSPWSSTHTIVRLRSVGCQSRVAAWYCNEDGRFGFVWEFKFFDFLYLRNMFAPNCAPLEIMKHSNNMMYADAWKEIFSMFRDCHLLD